MLALLLLAFNASGPHNPSRQVLRFVESSQTIRRSAASVRCARWKPGLLFRRRCLAMCAFLGRGPPEGIDCSRGRERTCQLRGGRRGGRGDFLIADRKKDAPPVFATPLSVASSIRSASSSRSYPDLSCGFQKLVDDLAPWTKAEYDHKRQFVRLWHVALGKLDQKLSVLRRSCQADNKDVPLQDVIRPIFDEISRVPFPNPDRPDDPNQEWHGRAGGGFLYSNRYNHGTINHFRTLHLGLYLLYMVQRDAPLLWAKLGRYRGLKNGSRETNQYLTAWGSALFQYNMLRWDESGGKLDVDMREVGTERSSHNGQFANNLIQHPGNAWLESMQPLVENVDWDTDIFEVGALAGLYYVTMPYTYMEIMKRVNLPKEFYLPWARALVQYPLDDSEFIQHGSMDLKVESDARATLYLEWFLVHVPHYADHIRMEYDHWVCDSSCQVEFGKSATSNACYSPWFQKAFETIFPGEKKEHLQELLSYWTFLNKQLTLMDVYIPKEDISMEVDGRSIGEQNEWLGDVNYRWKFKCAYPPLTPEAAYFQQISNDFDLCWSKLFDRDALTAYFPQFAHFVERQILKGKWNSGSG